MLPKSPKWGEIRPKGGTSCRRLVCYHPSIYAAKVQPNETLGTLFECVPMARCPNKALTPLKAHRQDTVDFISQRTRNDTPDLLFRFPYLRKQRASAWLSRWCALPVSPMYFSLHVSYARRLANAASPDGSSPVARLHAPNASIANSHNRARFFPPGNASAV